MGYLQGTANKIQLESNKLVFSSLKYKPGQQSTKQMQLMPRAPSSALPPFSASAPYLQERLFTQAVPT